MNHARERSGALAASVAVLFATGMVSTAHADLEEVIVTAQKHAQSANDVGISVNAFDGDMIKDLGVTTAEDIATYTPGLTVADGGYGFPIYAIRGVGFQDGVTASSSSTVGLYFDEVSIPYAVMTRGALFDVARVEVLKGPQGDLYGRNTTAGQINFVSNKPTRNFAAGLTAGYGRFGVFDADGYLSGPLTDSIQARLAVKTTQSGEGWQRSLTRPGDELGEQDVLAARTLINFDLSDAASLLLKLHYVQDRSDNQAPTAVDGRLIGLNAFGTPHVPANEYFLPTGAHFGETPPWWSAGNNRVADWTNVWVSPITGETVNLRPRRDNELRGVSANLQWDLGAVTLTSITSYDDFKRDDYNGIDGMEASVQETNNQTEIDVFGQELRLSGRSDKLLWIAGLYYSEDDAEEFYNFFMQDAIFGDGSAAFRLPLPFSRFPIYRLHTRYDQQTDSKAAFGHLEYYLTQKLRLTLGARYTRETRDWRGCTHDAGDGGYVGLWNGIFGASLPLGACSTMDDTPGSPTNIANVLGTPDINDAFHEFSSSIRTSKWMGKFGLDYAFNDDMLVYATVSSGFKSGGFNGNNSNTTSQLEPYLPEELVSYEVGLKATLLDNTMQLNTAAFFYDYENKQESERAITPVGAIGGLGNVDKSEVKGAEIDLAWEPLAGLNFTLGASYLDTEIKEWITPVSGQFDFAAGHPVNVVFVDASGSSLPQSPEWSFNAVASYEWLLTDSLQVQVSADVNHADAAPNPVRRQDSLDERTTYNARLALSRVDSPWRVMLWGRNITDEYYFVGAMGGTNGGYSRIVGMPRTYGVSVELDF